MNYQYVRGNTNLKKYYYYSGALLLDITYCPKHSNLLLRWRPHFSFELHCVKFMNYQLLMCEAIIQLKKKYYYGGALICYVNCIVA